MLRLLPCLLPALVTAAQSGEGLDVPSGPAQIIRLVLPKAYTEGGIVSDLHLGIVRRGGVPVSAWAVAPQWDIAPGYCDLSGVAEEGGTLALRVASERRMPGPGALAWPRFTADLRLTIAGGAVTGTALIAAGKQTLAVAGTARDAAQEATAFGPFAIERDWPNHHGPGGTCAARPSDAPLVSRLAEARLMWVSEQVVPYTSAGNEGIARAGTASPIVYGGNVYIGWYRPAGDAIDDQRLAEARKVREAPPGYTSEDLARVGADDHLACIDARTGLTRWTARFPDGMSRQTLRHKGFPGCTPAAGEGAVVVVGSAGMAYCLDAQSGALRWRKPLGTPGTVLQDTRRKALAERRIVPAVAIPGWSLGEFNPRPRIVDGVVLCTVHRRGVVALALADGALLWEKPLGTGWRGLPQIWDGPKGRLLIAPDDAGLAGFALRTGEAVWRSSDTAASPGNRAIQVVGDRLYLTPSFQNVGPGEAITTCWQLAEAGATRLWAAAVPADGAVAQCPAHPVILVDRLCYGGVRAMPVYVVDLAQGRVTATLPAFNGQNSYYSLWGAGDLLMRGSFTIAMQPIGTGGGQVTESRWLLAEGYDDNYPLPAIADGRMYARGYQGIICYDLRAAAR